MWSFLLSVWFFTSITASGTITWSAAAPSPIPRFEAGNEVVNDKLYVFGGYFTSSIQATTRSDVYDPIQNNWTQLSDMPEPITHAGVAVDGNTIYIAGGFVGDYPGSVTKEVYKYDVTSNNWNTLPSLPTGDRSGPKTATWLGLS